MWPTIISVIAIVISAISLWLTFLDRAEQRSALLLAKQTEVYSLLAERCSKHRHLALVYGQMLDILESKPPSDKILEEIERVVSNLTLMFEASQNCEELMSQVRDTKPANLEAWEDQLQTAKAFLAQVSSELEKEQDVLNQLRTERHR